MKIKTGHGTVPLMVVIAIWSLSLAVDLPGLAVTPIEGQLHQLFDDVTDFKIQLLTVLPNVVIIPFVLLSGKLSETRHKLIVIIAGIVLYALSGIFSIFSSSLTVLIWLSCLLGAGCGLILPFATGLIADVFAGSYRTHQMGIVSAIGNIALVAATFVVGFLASVSWHLPFVVYLIPIISLFLVPWLKKIPKKDLSDEADEKAGKENAQEAKEYIPDKKDDDHDGFSLANQKIVGGFYIGRTVWLMIAYCFFEFVCTLQTYYLPNLMPTDGMSVEDVSIVTSVFYFAMFVIGIFVTAVLRVFKKYTFIVSSFVIVLGFVIYLLSKDLAAFIISAGLIGLGNGQTQPIFYTKATEIVNDPAKSTLALAFLQAANYIGISIVPLIVNLFILIFGDHSPIFPFYVGAVLMFIAFVIICIRSRHFVFGIHRQYYAKMEVKPVQEEAH